LPEGAPLTGPRTVSGRFARALNARLRNPITGIGPSCRRAAEQRDEGAAFHSITSSARASSVVGISRPSAFDQFKPLQHVEVQCD
jgi:hypothetical protein